MPRKPLSFRASEDKHAELAEALKFYNVRRQDFLSHLLDSALNKCKEDMKEQNDQG